MLKERVQDAENRQAEAQEARERARIAGFALKQLVHLRSTPPGPPPDNAAPPPTPPCTTPAVDAPKLPIADNPDDVARDSSALGMGTATPSVLASPPGLDVRWPESSINKPPCESEEEEEEASALSSDSSDTEAGGERGAGLEAAGPAGPATASAPPAAYLAAEPTQATEKSLEDLPAAPTQPPDNILEDRSSWALFMGAAEAEAVPEAKDG